MVLKEFKQLAGSIGSLHGQTCYVTFPPGRARLATRPLPTGSAADANTIGIIDVACCAMTTDLVPAVTMTSTLNRTHSEAISAKRSVRQPRARQPGNQALNPDCP